MKTRTAFLQSSWNAWVKPMYSAGPTTQAKPQPQIALAFLCHVMERQGSLPEPVLKATTDLWSKDAAAAKYTLHPKAYTKPARIVATAGVPTPFPKVQIKNDRAPEVMTIATHAS